MKAEKMANFQTFLDHEKQILLDNIRRQGDMHPSPNGNESVARENERMIAVQKRYLAMLNTLTGGQPTPEQALAICEEALRMAEKLHSRLILDGKANCEACWESLDAIEFISELIRHIEDWKHRSQSNGYLFEPPVHDEEDMH
ncbi:MAG: hypothetical protein IPK19_38730 [Chloroflexi bacterium]|nr:hypothetical protein [Chloroflexota bacterium]